MACRVGFAKSQSYAGTWKVKLQNPRHGSQGVMGLSVGTQSDPNAHGAIGSVSGLLASRTELQTQPSAMAGFATIWQPRRRGWPVEFIDVDCSEARRESAWSYRAASHKTKTSSLPLTDQTASVSKGRGQEKWAR